MYFAWWGDEMDNIYYHVDVNSAFLSWEALYALEENIIEYDLRDVASVIGGDESKRHGIVLAKSNKAKSYGIQTGEPLVKARQKCPNLIVMPAHYEVYAKKSKSFIDFLYRYAPVVEQYSIDEAFCDMTGTEGLYGDLHEFAYTLKDKINEELGFTVNIGISDSKFLAKMASDFEKPNKVHTLYASEIKDKLWKLNVEDMLFVGKQTALKLHKYGINTIGDIANMDVKLLEQNFKKQGVSMWNYANGIDDNSIIRKEVKNKGYSNDITLPMDITDRNLAKKVILSLCETLGARIRMDKAYISVVSVGILDMEFEYHQKQITLDNSTDITRKIYETACIIFDKLWNNKPIRLLSVRCSKAVKENFVQYDLFENEKNEKLSKLDTAIDSIRKKYGENSIKRACFIEKDENI